MDIRRPLLLSRNFQRFVINWIIEVMSMNYLVKTAKPLTKQSDARKRLAQLLQFSLPGVPGEPQVRSLSNSHLQFPSNSDTGRPMHILVCPKTNNRGKTSIAARASTMYATLNICSRKELIFLVDSAACVARQQHITVRQGLRQLCSIRALALSFHDNRLA